ncbi:MAG: carbon-nitrogen hydrolase family protein [Thermomicrobiales bacterium]
MGTGNTITIGLAQLNSTLGESDINLRRAAEYIDRAAAANCDLVMFPELYLQGYRADDLFVDVAEPIPGPTTACLERLARERNLYIVMGMGRREESFPHLVYNSLCFVGPEGLLGHYDKVHLGTFHPYMEGVYFAPGRSAPVFDTRFGRVSLQICYDSWFPELTRTYALKGSILNLVISAGPSGSEDPWKTMLRARSMENAFPSVYCNTVGMQKNFSFFGGSKIVSAAGKVTTEAKYDEEDFVTGCVDLDEALRIRRHWLLFRERNPGVYATVTAQPEDLARM